MRPTKYKKEYCERIINLGKQGYSIAEMADDLDVVINTLKSWAEEHSEFLIAFTRAKDASKSWWERKSRINLENRDFQQPLWSRSMAARFPEDYRESSKTILANEQGESFKTENAHTHHISPELGAVLASIGGKTEPEHGSSVSGEE